MRLYFSLLIFLVALKAFTDGPPDITFVVETLTAKPELFQIKRNYIGMVGAASSSMLHTQSVGNVANVLVKDGDLVKKGQVLVTLDNAAQSKDLSLAKEQAASLKVEYERLKSLHQSGDVTTAKMEQAKRAWSQAKSAVEKSGQTVADTQVQAPFDGIVGVPRVDIGQRITAETEVISMVKGPFYLKVLVPASKLNELKIGQTALVLEQTGKVTAVEKFIDPKTRTGFAKVSLPGSSYLVGSSVPLQIVILENPQAILIPEKAIFYQDKKPFVVVIKDDKAEHRQIVTGAQQDGMVEITSGLQVGEVVVKINPKRLMPGSKVKVSS
jgi:membrane fusion protein (multidrug efflux system)